MRRALVLQPCTRASPLAGLLIVAKLSCQRRRSVVAHRRTELMTARTGPRTSTWARACILLLGRRALRADCGAGGAATDQVFQRHVHMHVLS